MKHFKKLIAAALTMFVALAVSTVALAATTGTITINNAAKGETYKIYKVLGATVGEGGAISYNKEDIPDVLKDLVGEVTITKDGKTYKTVGKLEGVSDKDVTDALNNWAAGKNPDATATADSNTVVFDNVPAGYYVITSTQGSTIMIDSATDPSATVYEKNTKTITANKEVEKATYTIGETVKYTATFDTTNYFGTGETAKIITKYEISDTLPEFLSGTTVTSIKIGVGEDVDAYTEYKVNGAVPQFDANKKITIPWATKDETVENAKWESIYASGSKIIVTYEAVLTSVTNINAVDTNSVSIQPVVGENDERPPAPENETWHDEATISTYAAAIQKLDENNEPLAGASFKVKGLVVTGQAGVYTVVSYDPTSEALSDELVTNDDGELFIIGLASDATLTVSEFAAPEGYNKLTSELTLTPQVLQTTVYVADGEIFYDAYGNVVSQRENATTTTTVDNNLDQLVPGALKVVNNKGTELPSTGGIGTTIFYIVGGIMVVAAGVLLITKKRVANN